ncbi:MAG TPA: Zn-ribbon domain-containing OB-fold protein [Acetobacteraceae bacterium]|nr:Zn-ribbon domain-containing OB-fold protein [Acetobacteraceae bacterium]
MAYTQRKIPFVGTPDTNPETKAVFDGFAAGKLMVPRCNSCGKPHWYPRGICPHCFSQDLKWEQASGSGTIYSFSVMKRAEVPYAIAYVTLDNGPTMMTNIVDCDLDSLKIGQKVKLKFVPSEGGPPMPMFTPA